MRRFLKHFRDWLAFHARSEPYRIPVAERQEQMAAMHIWPTTGRSVKATPQNAPAQFAAAGRATEERTLDGTTS